MLEITGGVSATALAYIFPAACYLKLLDSNAATANDVQANASSHDGQGPPSLGLRERKTMWLSRERLPALACVIFGTVVMALSLWFALQKVWTHEGDARMCAS